MSRGSKSALFAVIVTLLVASVTQAQTNSVITGVVKDATGAVLPGVTVEASSAALIEKVRAAVTDSTGQYRIVELRPGTYSVTFTLPGFSTVKHDGVMLTTGFAATVNAELRVGNVAETITVSGQSPVIDFQNVAQQRVLTREVIDTIPTGSRSFANLGVLVPGATVSGLGAGVNDVGGSAGNNNQTLAIHGSRQFDMVNLVDGMTVGQVVANGAVSSMTFPDGNVEEINLEIGAHSTEMESGGIRVNIIPKSGGNTFSGSFFASYTNESLQTDNLSDDLRTRGLTSVNGIKYLSDINPSIGGPIAKDRLWFYGGYRNWRTILYSPLFPDTNPSDWVYTPDSAAGRVLADQLTWNASGRLTWQATSRDKFAVNLAYDDRCDCHSFMGGVTMPEASAVVIYPSKLVQGTWVAPLTNRLLAEAGVSSYLTSLESSPQPTAVGPPAIELANGFQFRSRSNPGPLAAFYQLNKWYNYSARGSLSYVTGAHAFKTGFSFNPGTSDRATNAPTDYLVYLLNGLPNRADYLPTPYKVIDKFRKGAVYGQDQWTVRQFTVNAGLRFDWINTHYPDVNLPATRLLPERHFPGADVLGWKDLSPRLGIAYDLFGKGRTALKLSISRYVALEATDLTRAVNPANTTGGLLARAWSDTDGDFFPDGDPLNPAPNGELIGPTTNLNFGKPVVTGTYDTDWTQGWGLRGANWETSASIHHQLAAGVSVDAAYVRRAYGNFFVADNQLVAPTDYDTYCITAPNDPRLPDGGGNQICDLFDVRPDKVGQLNNLTTLSSEYGEQEETWNGVDFTMNARLPGRAILQGGVSTGKTMTDRCDVVTKVDNPSRLYCRVETSLLTQAKLVGSLTLPWSLRFAATFQSVPGPQVSANYVATNAVIAPSLGRNLSSGANGTATINLVAPGTMYGERMNQFDIRFARTFEVGFGRLSGMIDVYNALNSNDVLTFNNTYGTNGAAWLVPQAILQGRLVKFSAHWLF
jgi:hypothetical protein